MAKGKGKAEERLLALMNQAGKALMSCDWQQADSLAAEIEGSGAAEAELRAAELRVSLAIEQGKTVEAGLALQRLNELAPEEAYTLFLTARVRFMAGERVQVLPLLAAAREEQRGASAGLLEKIYNLEGQIARRLGDALGAARAYRMAAEYGETKEDKEINYSNYLFNLHYLPLEGKALLEESRGYGEIFRELEPLRLRRGTPRQRLTIGYLSPDIRNHVVLRFSWALFQYYNRENFRVIVYMSGTEDRLSEKVRDMVDGWHSVRGWSAARTAAQIAADGVDILVELAGHTQGGGLPVLAYRPAPVQMTGIGYFAPSGLPAVGYVLGDRYLDAAQPEAGFPQLAGSAEFDERVLVLEHSHFCYTPLQETPEPQGAPCLQRGYVTFGSFNNFTKVNDEVLALWGRLLGLVPGSKLLLKAELCGSEEGRSLILARLEELGIDAARVELRGISLDYLQEYAEVDIALDTFPYPGGGTTCDALYMGVPVVTMRGETHGARFGCSLLQNVGLGELVADTAEDYLARAAGLAGDRETLQLLHLNLRRLLEASPVMDGKGYLQELEAGYQLLWTDYCQHQRVLAASEAEGLVQPLRRALAQGQQREALALADEMLEAEVSAGAMELVTGTYLDYQDGRALCAAEKYVRVSGGSGYAHTLLARAAQEAGDWGRAEAEVQLALSRGDMQPWQEGLALNLAGMLAKNLGRPKEAMGYFERSLACANNLAARLDEYGNLLLASCHAPGSAEEERALAEGYQELLAGIKEYRHKRRQRHEKIRLGYLSPDFGRHVMAHFAWPLLQAADSDCFEVYAYALGRADDLTKQLQASAQVWREIGGMDAAEAAALIYQDEIDILVDLAGHTKGTGLPILAFRPAPVQVSGLGYMASTGLKAVDYFLGDRWTEGAVLDGAAEARLAAGLPVVAARKAFTERLLVLPHSHFCYYPIDAPRGFFPAPFIKQGFITFGSLNNYAKLTDEQLGLWGKILAAVAGSKLLLKAAAFDKQYARQQAMARLAAVGIGPERVILEGHTADYQLAYSKIDIALDTYPYPGGGTTADALYNGVPVVTKYDRRHNGCFGLSFLANVGLRDLCAATDEEYVAAAVALAGDKGRLAELHRSLRRTMLQSPVMDQEGYLVEMENAYRLIWAAWLDGAAPGETAAATGRRQALQQAEAEAEASFQAKDWQRVLRCTGMYLARGGAKRQLLSQAALAAGELGRWSTALFLIRLALLGTEEAELPLERYTYGSALRGTVRHVEAVEALRQAVAAAERGADKAVLKAALTTLAQEERILGLADEAAGHYLQAAHLAADEQAAQSAAGLYSSYLLCGAEAEGDEAKFFRAHVGFGTLLRPLLPAPLPPRSRLQHQRLRLGLLSADLRQHVMFPFLFQLLAHLNRERFELYCYYLGTEQDGYTAQAKARAENWREAAGLAPAALAAKIRQDEIDIALDFSGHSSGSGLAALLLRPAPLQVSGLGYMATTGLQEIDYFLTDSYLDPEGAGHEQFFTEKMLRLTSHLCYTGRSDVPAPQGSPVKQRGYLTFGVFNHYYKYTDEMLLAWRELMSALPTSRLLLKCQLYVSASAVKLVSDRLARLGFDLDRVDFEPATLDYMERYLGVDIALDTFPYPGGGTTCDALYMGVPVVNRYGSTHGSRFGLSLLQNVGLGELSVESVEEYKARALLLAGDTDLLDTLHRTLRGMLQKSPVMNGRRWTQELEQSLQDAWERL